MEPLTDAVTREDGAIDCIVTKRHEPSERAKWHGAEHDDEYRKIANGENLGIDMASIPLMPDEIEYVLSLPHIESVELDDPIAIPEPIDMATAPAIESAQDAFDFHNITDDIRHGTYEKAAYVVVLDTGIDRAHVDGGQFRGFHMAENFTSTADAWDYQGHGTWCCGAIASEEYGIEPQAWLSSGKVLDDYGSGWSSWIIAGIDWAIAEGADVISMSLGGPGAKDSPLSTAVNNAYLQGKNVVVAAGNDQRGSTSREADYQSPANARYATTVGALDINGYLAVFSNWGYCLDISALGVRAEGLALNGQFGRLMSGTSMATPYVAGAMAQLRRWYNNYQAKIHMYDTAIDTSYQATKEGNGRLDIGASLA